MTISRWVRCIFSSSKPASRGRRPATRLALEQLENRVVPAVGLFSAPQSVAVGSLPIAAVTADFNGDGHPDVAVLNAASSSVSILLNDGSGHFLVEGTAATGTSPRFLAAADVNRDGKPDLIVADANGDIDLLTQTGIGLFNAPVLILNASGTSITSPGGIAVGDSNGTGNTTIALIGNDNSGLAHVDFLYLDSSGAFASGVGTVFPSGASLTAVTMADFNKDGFQDVLTTRVVAGNTAIVDFAGSSTGVTSGLGIASLLGQATGITTGDFNGDGNLDMAVSVFSGGNSQVVLGNGAGGFAGLLNIGTGSNGTSIAAGDFNGDGVLDLAITDAGNATLSVFINDGTANFTTAAGSPMNGADLGGAGPSGLAVADFNGDGGADLIAINSGDNNIGEVFSRFQTTTTVTLVSGTSTSSLGQSLTFQATVRPRLGASLGGLLGSVQFFDNGVPLGSPMSISFSGQASITTTGLAAGPHSITAQFSGNFGFQPGTSAALIQQVTQAGSITALSTSGSPSGLGQSVGFSATVIGASGASVPTGPVSFFDAGTFIGSASLINGTATLLTNGLSLGTHLITAQYAGDSNYAASPISNAVTQDVTGPAQLAFGAPIASGSVGQPLATITVNVGNAAGQLVPGAGGIVTLTLTGGTFSTGSTTASVNVVGGVAMFTNLMINRVGVFTLTATDGTLTPATSNSFPVSFTDNFAGTGSLSSAWKTASGGFSVAGNQATSKTTSVNLATLAAGSQPNVSTSVTVNSLVAGQSAMLVERYQGTGDRNMYIGGIVNAGSNHYFARIWKNVNGTWTMLTSMAIPNPFSGGSFTIRFDAIGSSLRVFLVNGATTTLLTATTDATFTSGSVGMRVTGSAGVKLSNYNAAPLVQTTATLPYNLGFTSTPEGQLGNDWLVKAGDYTVQAGTARAVNSGANVAVLNMSAAANFNLSVSVSSLAVGQSAGLVGRYHGSGDTNMYMADLIRTSTNYQAQIWKNVNGTWTLLASKVISNPFGVGPATVQFTGTGSTLKVFVNGTLSTLKIDTTFTTGLDGIRANPGVLLSGFTAS